ncbi:hypothetical protein SmJEL517_g00751 [Synchytrium microbalum]|uniref:AN1-type domain-containing protein n=1 Tax=Synchytrium microbalum TaxID=1806994 RepID=A0A507C7P8_9FUNG|nr:uncharacterized protein SmJEL517_g00751 [Synchytrium microbalum]TPX37600.1 hypothetical protein SmJEL517_g00751 [Synchytrium microbalum]
MSSVDATTQSKAAISSTAPSEAATLPSSSDPNTTSTAPITPSKKNKCAVEGCIERPVKIIGDCRYCLNKYCSKHRLPEAHVCSGLQTCRDESVAKLTGKLMVSVADW